MLSSNWETIINNRIGWAITYLKKAGFLESRKWGFVNITDFGLDSFNKKHFPVEKMPHIIRKTEYLRQLKVGCRTKNKPFDLIIND